MIFRSYLFVLKQIKIVDWILCNITGEWQLDLTLYYTNKYLRSDSILDKI